MIIEDSHRAETKTFQPDYTPNDGENDPPTISREELNELIRDFRLKDKHFYSKCLSFNRKIISSALSLTLSRIKRNLLLFG